MEITMDEMIKELDRQRLVRWTVMDDMIREGGQTEGLIRWRDILKNDIMRKGGTQKDW